MTTLSAMVDALACERRVFRLAVLLTGSQSVAVAVIRAVLRAQPNLARLDSARMDRLTILRSRELEQGGIGAGAAIVDPDLPAPHAQAVASLRAQQREAWILMIVFEIPLREAARAMDCSTTAAQRHLELALEAIGDVSAAAAESFRSYAARIELPQFYREQRRRAARLRRVWKVIALILLIGLMLVGARFGLGWLNSADG